MITSSPTKTILIKLVYKMGFLTLCACLLFPGCGEKEKPPYYTVELTNVYNEKIVVEHFMMTYWWEERGETPFLKPHTYSTKECIMETLIPFQADPDRVTVKTERIPFERIDAIDIFLADTGKTIIISGKDGNKITGTNNFPASLKTDSKAGLADHKIFVQGIVMKGERRTEYKQELDYIKQIKFLKSFSK
jgi:hypothetical protein